MEQSNFKSSADSLYLILTNDDNDYSRSSKYNLFKV